MVTKKIIIDTNILIDYLRLIDKTNVISRLQKFLNDKTIIPLISSTTVQELFAGSSSKYKTKELELKNILNLFKTIPITKEIAELAGIIIRDTKPIVSFPDAQIAATAILESAYLATLNQKDFINIKEIKLYEQY